ncbi:MAG TPA: hypothetical protein VHE35_31030 [Kofleriaceae bacterium]|nr:hypothetical protein [Kofleriaceae bacterium]
MRTNLLMAFLVAASAALPAVASADASDSLVGRYDVAFEQVTSNCDQGLTLAKASMAIEKKGAGVSVDLPKVATLTGKAPKAGRLKAASAVARTSVAGLDGKFSIAGSIDDAGHVDAVFVGEFYKDAKPICTQSWHVTGTRAADAKAPAAPQSAGDEAPIPAPTPASAASSAASFGRFALLPFE